MAGGSIWRVDDLLGRRDLLLGEGGPPGLLQAVKGKAASHKIYYTAAGGSGGRTTDQGADGSWLRETVYRRRERFRPAIGNC